MSDVVLHGYGKALEVDLSTGQVVKRDIDPAFALTYLGGMGFGCKILYDEVGPDVDPLGPENVVVFANGPLTGTQAPCSGRTEITTKDPLTGSIGSGNMGGLWGAVLKHAGIDLIVVRNRADRPVYLWIDEGSVFIRDAGHLWGLDTWETSDRVVEETEPSRSPRVSVLAIGPAGENLVRYACAVGDYFHVAARCGAGAVMGSKKLKAIAVRGSGAVNIARPDEFQEAVGEARERLASNPETARRVGHTTSVYDMRRDYVERGCLPGKNFQTGFIEGFLETRGQDVARKYVTGRAGTCYACPIPCFNMVEVKEGKYAGLKYSSGTRIGFAVAWGATCAIDNLPAIWKCNELCGRLGMDYCSSSGAVAFAMELFQRGLITKSDTGGLDMTWGNEDAVMEMLRRIAYRQGFGDVLAEGTGKAAQRLGKGTEKYAMTVKGREMVWTDPRSSPRGWMLGYLTNPRGGDNVKGSHFFADIYNPGWWVDKMDMFEDVKKSIYGAVPAQEISDAWQGKAAMCKWFEDLYSALNALGMCFFPAGFLIVLGPTYLSRMMSAMTSRDVSPRDIMVYGERVFNLFKAYTVRQGLTRSDDHFPDRFYTEPLPEGPARGTVLSRAKIDEVLDEYYDLRGWDRQSGLPTERKLVELGLGDVARELRQLGRLPR